MPLFCYYFVTRIHWSNKTNRYICIGNKMNYNKFLNKINEDLNIYAQNSA